MTQRIVVFPFCFHYRCGSALRTTLLETISHHFSYRCHSVRDMVSFVEPQSGCVQRGFQLCFRGETGRGLEDRLVFVQPPLCPPPCDECEFSLQPVVARASLGKRPVSEVRILSCYHIAFLSSLSSPRSWFFFSWTRFSSAAVIASAFLSTRPS